MIINFLLEVQILLNGERIHFGHKDLYRIKIILLDMIGVLNKSAQRRRCFNN